MLERLNFANALATNRIKGTRIDAARVFGDVDANDSQAIADRLIKLLAGDVSRQTRKALETVSSKVPTLCGPSISITGKRINYDTGQNKGTASVTGAPCVAGIAEVITIVIGSPEFQRR